MEFYKSKPDKNQKTFPDKTIGSKDYSLEKAHGSENAQRFVKFAFKTIVLSLMVVSATFGYNKFIEFRDWSTLQVVRGFYGNIFQNQNKPDEYKGKEVILKYQENLNLEVVDLEGENMTGPLIIFIPGAGGPNTEYRIIQEIKKYSSRIIFPYHPGTGQSQGDPVKENLENLSKAVYNYTVEKYNISKDKITIATLSAGTYAGAYLAGEDVKFSKEYNPSVDEKEFNSKSFERVIFFSPANKSFKDICDNFVAGEYDEYYEKYFKPGLIDKYDENIIRIAEEGINLTLTAVGCNIFDPIAFDNEKMFKKLDSNGKYVLVSASDGSFLQKTENEEKIIESGDEWTNQADFEDLFDDIPVDDKDKKHIRYNGGHLDFLDEVEGAITEKTSDDINLKLF